jgi:hypothetical protein
MNQMSQAQAQALFEHMMWFGVPFFFIVLLVVIIPYWFIFKKAGFSPWLSLLMFVPLGNIIMLYVLAFAEWKVVPVQSVLPVGYPPIPPRI